MKQIIHRFIVFITILTLLGVAGTGAALAVSGASHPVVLTDGMDFAKCKHAAATMSSCATNFCGFPLILPSVSADFPAAGSAYFIEVPIMVDQHKSRPSIRPA